MNSSGPRAWGLGLAGGLQAPLSPESDAGLVWAVWPLRLRMFNLEPSPAHSGTPFQGAGDVLRSQGSSIFLAMFLQQILAAARSVQTCNSLLCFFLCFLKHHSFSEEAILPSTSGPLFVCICMCVFP